MQLNGLSLAITNVLGGRLNPLSWFAAGEQGAWYDPSDFQPNWRRNLLTYSQAIGGTNWTIFGNVGGVCNQNDSIAPDGTLTASKFIIFSYNSWINKNNCLIIYLIIV